MKDRDTETIENRHLAFEGDVISQFQSVHDQHGVKTNYLYLEITQSWHPKESKLFAPEKYNQMGIELAQRLFPDHQMQVVTHQDKAHIHNHIMVNKVNSITGKMIHDKKGLLYTIRDMNDTIAKENGLSVLNKTLQARDAQLPQAVRKMVANGKRSYLYDIMQKADFARAASTGFDEYVTLLREFGVDARVENKNLSYFYGDKTKGVRGKKLGLNYTNDGLIKAFKENDEKFAKSPGLRNKLRGELSSIVDSKGNIVGAASDLLLESAGHTKFGKKNFGEFTKVARDRTRAGTSSALGYDGVIPLQEITKARSQSIFDYCERNRIALHTNKSGERVVTGREFVVIDGTSWKNKKNHTNGSLIEFAALHHDETFLQAIARINRNPRLLQLEAITGEVKRTFNSFYLPKGEQLGRKASLEYIKHFSNVSSMSERAMQDLFELKKLQVARNGSIWLFAGNKGTHAIEFYQENGSFQKKVHGDPLQAFEVRRGTGKRVVVFRDPFEYLAHKDRGAKLNKQDSVFVALDLHHGKSLDLFLSENPHVRQVDIVSTGERGRKNERSEIERLKKHFDPFSIEVRGIDMIGPSHSSGRGPDIGL